MSEQPSMAAAINKEAADADIEAIVRAVNACLKNRRASQASAIAALTAMLGQSIAASGPQAAGEIRRGIFRLIDTNALRAAMERPAPDAR